MNEEYNISLECLKMAMELKGGSSTRESVLKDAAALYLFVVKPMEFIYGITNNGNT